MRGFAILAPNKVGWVEKDNKLIKPIVNIEW